MNTNKFAYLAGYIDGDGCFFVRTYIQKPKNILVFDYSIQICSIDENIIQYFTKEFDGTFNIRPEKRKNFKKTYLWTIKTKQSIVIADQIINFLIIKKITCELFLQVGKSIVPNCGQSICKSIITTRQKIFKKIKEEIHMNNIVNEDLFKSIKNVKKTIEPTVENFAYFAGLIDAEGCFRIGQFQSKRIGRSRSYVSILEIGNTKFKIFPWLMERFGGTIFYRKPTKQNHRPMIIWTLKSKVLHQILDKIYPFLKVKQEKCKKLMDLRNTTMPNGNRKSENYKLRQAEVLSIRECIAIDLHILNAKGRH